MAPHAASSYPTTSAAKPVPSPSFGSNAKKPAAPAASTGSNMSTARTRDVECHTCGGRGHYQRDCPNRKVMFVNDQGEYESGDDVDPDDHSADYEEEGLDAFPEHAPTTVVYPHIISVQPVVDSQRCNLFQTKAL